MSDEKLKKVYMDFFPPEGPKCKTHQHYGRLPCPWPDCLQGIKESSFLGVTPGINDERQFERKQWLSFDGKERFSWNEKTNTAFFEARRIFQEELLRQNNLEPPLRQLVYHYTSIEGLYGIIQSKAIWMTDYAYLNDSSEIDHGLKIAIEILSEFNNDTRYNNKLDLIQKWKETIQNKTNSRICIACFSADGDSLSNWRGYGGSSVGVSIGFATGKYFNDFMFPPILKRVVYDEIVQRRILSAMFHTYLITSEWDEGKTFTGFNNRELDPNIIKEGWQEDVITDLIFQVAFFKNISFADEREIRWVYIENENSFKNMNLSIAPKYFRIKNNLIIPYMKSIDMDTTGVGPLLKRENSDRQLPIEEIVVGPQKNIDLIMRGIRTFLNENGFEEVEIKKSSIPFRPS